MLSYSIKLDDKSIRRDELVWSEKYLAPDRSFVSGVTSQDYHIEKKDFIAFSVGNETNADSLRLSCENVTRNGYIKIKDKVYDIQSGETINYVTNQKINYRYVNINDVIYYVSGSTITVKNWLKEEWTVETIDGEEKYSVNIVEDDVEATVDGDVVYLDTIVWIEDEMVGIDGNKYFFDRYDLSSASLSPGGVKYYEDGECLSASAITRSKNNEIYYNHFEDTSEYIYVTKFILTQKEQMLIDFDRLSFCTYFYYVKYKDNYCPVSVSGDNYICEVLERLYTEDIQEGNEKYYDTSAFTVYYEEYDESEEEYVDVELTLDIVSRISLLKGVDAFIKIEGEKLMVDYMLQNANHGDELAIYLSDRYENVALGDIITLECDSSDSDISGINTMSGETFVLYNNKKYKVIERLCDKVMINDHEYPIEYINGISGGVDCLVDIMGEKVPMKIVDDAGTKLERYGEIISGNSPSAVTVTYNVIKHNGVNIGNKIYQVYSGLTDTSFDNDINMFIEIDNRVPYQFVVNSIEGGSLLVCTPNFSTYEFDDEFRDRINSNICKFFVDNQEYTAIYIKNSSFGKRDITTEIGYANGEVNPLSSNDYYNLFDNLVLYVDTAHIHIPIKLDANVDSNIIQDDVIEKNFYEVEKEKAINSIVDMEKDVYIPKYIPTTEYSGSTTEFLPISEIEVNLHFRTRNLQSWRVNDGNTDVSTSGTMDNWFVTDFYPYNQMLADSGDVLQNTSDLMGLLYFTNDDIYYQKNKVGKSFLRFSYYDSPDPNTQSLLATSTVFMDEHKLFKTYMDNSRRNVYDYGLVEAYQEDDDDYRKVFNNKITVKTELIGKHDPKRKEYGPTDLDLDSLSGDTRRISSRFLINNKYETDTSSEGFYLYIFKEYSENLHPKPIYMKVEFNHAGIGRTIPFIVPMHWTSGTVYNNNDVNIFNPASALTLSDANDLAELKKGYPLSYVYAQTYIPLYAVYDFNEKEYAYVFDERYIVSPNSDNAHNRGRVVLNLFELKVADESAPMEETDKERENVRMGRGSKALINVNTEQFNRIYFNKEYR